THTDVEVLVLSDISASTDLFKDYPGVNQEGTAKGLEHAIYRYLQLVCAFKRPQDRMGVISIGDSPQIDVIPSTALVENTLPIRPEGMRDATNIGAAIELAQATFGQDVMH